MVYTAGNEVEWQLDPSVEGSFVVDHADSLNGTSLSLSAKTPPILAEDKGDENPETLTRREEEEEEEQGDGSADMVPKVIGAARALCYAMRQTKDVTHFVAGLPGQAWPVGDKPSVQDPAERLRKIVCQLIEKSERSRIMFMWRLNATRSKASALAVWAVDQGNRKAYEVERALMAENSWATRSIIWEGYRHSPLVGVTDSGWYWSRTDAYGEAKGAEQLAGELQLATQRCSYLGAQLEAARQQLMEWQEVADFQSVDGAWTSLRLRHLERQLKAARLHHRLRPHPHPHHSAPAPDLPTDSPDPDPADPDPDSREPPTDRRPMNLRSWMMGYESEREIRSTLPGLATTPRAGKGERKGRGKESESASEGSGGEFGDERMRELLVGVPSGPLRASQGEGAAAGGAREGNGGGSSPQGLVELQEELVRERERREGAERKYEELRGMAVHLEETLLETVHALELSSLHEQRLRAALADARPQHPRPLPDSPDPLPPSPALHKPLPPTHRSQASQTGGADGLIWCPEALASIEAPPPPSLPQASPDTPPRPPPPAVPAPPPRQPASAPPAAEAGAPAEGAAGEGGVEGREDEAEDAGKDEGALRAELKELRQLLRQRTAQLKEAVAIGVGIEWVM